ncbi:phosphate-starvation-inducible protein PsiE [Erythrobacter sp.]|jgi:protein PsiE|uniref:phosphate-starvation-inducible protein PsiE n=1 Tax=Erythrobacter sp. TaxID=1042 RepID=UPI002EC3B903|nr:phosphate-starvation-inducible PsiE family protein [Erythrobacter sp.]
MSDASQDVETGETSPPLADRTFKALEHLLLIIATAMTLAAVVAEVVLVFEKRSVDLADILLMFLYTEVLAMIAIFYTGRGSFFVFPIFIAITALARLIVLQGKDMAPQNVLFEAGAIFLLAIAALIMGRVKSD